MELSVKLHLIELSGLIGSGKTTALSELDLEHGTKAVSRLEFGDGAAQEVSDLLSIKYGQNDNVMMESEVYFFLMRRALYLFSILPFGKSSERLITEWNEIKDNVPHCFQGTFHYAYLRYVCGQEPLKSVVSDDIKHWFDNCFQPFMLNKDLSEKLRSVLLMEIEREAGKMKVEGAVMEKKNMVLFIDRGFVDVLVFSLGNMQRLAGQPTISSYHKMKISQGLRAIGDASVRFSLELNAILKNYSVLLFHPEFEEEGDSIERRIFRRRSVYELTEDQTAVRPDVLLINKECKDIYNELGLPSATKEDLQYFIDHYFYLTPNACGALSQLAEIIGNFSKSV